MQPLIRDLPSAGWCPPTLISALMTVDAVAAGGVSGSVNSCCRSGDLGMTVVVALGSNALLRGRPLAIIRTIFVATHG